MKFKTARAAAFSAKMALVLLLVTALCTPGFASEKLSELRLGTQGDNAIVLFPDHETKEFGFEVETPQVIRVDYYDWEYSGTSTIIPAPHPLVKFMRVSQVSSSPDVVRAIIVLNEPSRIKPARVGKSLVLEAARPARPAGHSSLLYSEKASGVRTEAGDFESKTALDSRISLSFDQEDLMTILNALAVKFNLRVFADAGVTGKFSVHAQDVTLREVLKNLLLQRNFQYTLKGRDLTVISLGTDSSRMARELLFRDLSLKDALQTLSKMMNVNLIIHDSVEDKKVNFYVENLNLDELLDLLIETNGLVKKPHNDNTFVILARESASDFGNKQFRAFKLINAAPQEVTSLIKSSKALSEKISTENFSINDRINTLSVYDTAENLNLIASIIDSIDEKVKQAVIEVKLVEINRSSLKELGIKQVDSLGKASYKIDVADIGRLPTSYALPARLSFLEETEGAKVLASPKIRAVHKKPARIFIGRTIPIPYYDYATTASSPYAVYTTTTQSLKRYKDVEVGIELNVTPEISRDNEISLDLVTEITDIDGEPNEDGQYRFATKSTKTYVRIKDGETIVLGGLISHSNRNIKNSPALLNKIPMLRTLLTNTKSSEEEREMIMLVTPRLVNLEEEGEYYSASN